MPLKLFNLILILFVMPGCGFEEKKKDSDDLKPGQRQLENGEIVQKYDGFDLCGKPASIERCVDHCMATEIVCAQNYSETDESQSFASGADAEKFLTQWGQSCEDTAGKFYVLGCGSGMCSKKIVAEFQNSDGRPSACEK